MNGVKKDSLASQGSGRQLVTESPACLPEMSLGWGASDSVFLQSRTLERDLSLDNESGIFPPNGNSSAGKSYNSSLFLSARRAESGALDTTSCP